MPRLALLAGIWAGLVGLLVAAGEVIRHSAAVTHFDHDTTHNVVSSRTSALNSIMEVVTWLGSWVALVVTAALIALLVLTKHLPVFAAVVAVFTWVGEASGVRIAREVVSRSRPPRAIWLVNAHGWSFPSGHAATASLVFAVVATCLSALARWLLVRILACLPAGLAIAATAFSRVELGVHWTTDVITSVIFVACWLTAIAVSLGGLLRRTIPSRDETAAS